jgi:hypothetical protein
MPPPAVNITLPATFHSMTPPNALFPLPDRLSGVSSALGEKQSPCIRAFSGFAERRCIRPQALQAQYKSVLYSASRDRGRGKSVLYSAARGRDRGKSLLYSAAKGRDRVQKCFVLCRKGSGPSTKVFCTLPQGVGTEVKVFCTLPQGSATEPQRVGTESRRFGAEPQGLRNGAQFPSSTPVFPILERPPSASSALGEKQIPSNQITP